MPLMPLGFFDLLVDPAWLKSSREHEGQRSAPWLGPPPDVLPHRSVTHHEVARTPDLAIWISGTSVFPSGMSLELQVRWRGERRVMAPLIPGQRGRRGLCLGVLFDDGRRVLAKSPSDLHGQSQPEQAGLTATARTAGTYQATTDLWLWPLPDQPLTWVLEWQFQRVAETHVPFEADSLAALARSARPPWSGTLADDDAVESDNYHS